MKRTLIFLFCFTPLIGYAISNLKLNGQKEVTVNVVPSFVVMTCDLSKPGQWVEGGIFADANHSETFDLADRNWVWRWGITTDGIGWITDPANVLASILGDETGVDGKLKVTFPILRQNVKLYPRGSVFVYLKEKDGTEAVAKIKLNIPPTPPLIQGRMTAAGTGKPIVNGYIEAIDTADANGDGFRMAYTDMNGDYFLMLDPHTWELRADAGPTNSQFKTQSTTTITLTNGQTETRNFSMESWTSFIEGTLKKKDGSPVVGLIVTASHNSLFTSSNGISDSTGAYRIGVPPGNLTVQLNWWNGNNFAWPAAFYQTPQDAKLSVADGQTVKQDWVFEPFKEFIEGVCLVDSQPAANINIQVDYIATPGNVSRTNQTFADQTGKYRIGVLPGLATQLRIFNMSLEMLSPARGYSNITVNSGQTVTGKDFALTLVGGGNSIKGKITGPGGVGSKNTYVVAVEEATYSPVEYKVVYTDQNGNFSFDNLIHGNWRVGAFQGDAVIKPSLKYYTLDNVTQITDANFTLSYPTSVAAAGENLPTKFTLMANHPNPFNPITKIEYVLPSSRASFSVSLSISDLLGRTIKDLVQDRQSPGRYLITWDGTDALDHPMASGVYFYTLKAEGICRSGKMMLVR